MNERHRRTIGLAVFVVGLALGASIVWAQSPIWMKVNGHEVLAVEGRTPDLSVIATIAICSVGAIYQLSMLLRASNQPAKDWDSSNAEGAANTIPSRRRLAYCAAFSVGALLAIVVIYWPFSIVAMDARPDDIVVSTRKPGFFAVLFLFASVTGASYHAIQFILDRLRLRSPILKENLTNIERS